MLFLGCVKRNPLPWWIGFLRIVAGQTYKLMDDYNPTVFLDMFEYYSSYDPTNGHVQYVNQTISNMLNLTTATEDVVYLKVDTVNKYPLGGKGRPSLRLISKQNYTHGLFILDIEHMPTGCGTWPAYWLLGPNWPNNGEIDVLEGANVDTNNHITLHTSANCSVAGLNQTAIYERADCAYRPPFDNYGCGNTDPRTSSYGKGFNSIKGGIYATEWTSNWIRVWFFPRNGVIPTSVLVGAPNPSLDFGKPAANFAGNCNIDAHFAQMQVIFNTDFCGDWAGNTYAYTTCPQTSGLSGWDSCVAFVGDNPGNFTEAYWGIRSLRVYQQPSNLSYSSIPVPQISSTPLPLASVSSVPAIDGGMGQPSQSMPPIEVVIGNGTANGSHSTPTYDGPNTLTTDTQANPTTLSCPGSDGFIYETDGGSRWQIECYTDHAGGDMPPPGAFFDVTTLEDCISHCSTRNDCFGVSWVNSAKACYLKSTIGAPSSIFGVYAAVLVGKSPMNSVSSRKISIIPISSAGSLVMSDKTSSYQSGLATRMESRRESTSTFTLYGPLSRSPSSLLSSSLIQTSIFTGFTASSSKAVGVASSSLISLSLQKSASTPYLPRSSASSNLNEESNIISKTVAYSTAAHSDLFSDTSTAPAIDILSPTKAESNTPSTVVSKNISNSARTSPGSSENQSTRNSDHKSLTHSNEHLSAATSTFHPSENFETNSRRSVQITSSASKSIASSVMTKTTSQPPNVSQNSIIKYFTDAVLTGPVAFNTAAGIINFMSDSTSHNASITVFVSSLNDGLLYQLRFALRLGSLLARLAMRDSAKRQENNEACSFQILANNASVFSITLNELSNAFANFTSTNFAPRNSTIQLTLIQMCGTDTYVTDLELTDVVILVISPFSDAESLSSQPPSSSNLLMTSSLAQETLSMQNVTSVMISSSEISWLLSTTTSKPLLASATVGSNSSGVGSMPSNSSKLFSSTLPLFPSTFPTCPPRTVTLVVTRTVTGCSKSCSASGKPSYDWGSGHLTKSCTSTFGLCYDCALTPGLGWIENCIPITGTMTSRDIFRMSALSSLHMGNSQLTSQKRSTLTSPTTTPTMPPSCVDVPTYEGLFYDAFGMTWTISCDAAFSSMSLEILDERSYQSSFINCLLACDLYNVENFNSQYQCDGATYVYVPTGHQELNCFLGSNVGNMVPRLGFMSGKLLTLQYGVNGTTKGYSFSSLAGPSSSLSAVSLQGSENVQISSVHITQVYSTSTEVTTITSTEVTTMTSYSEVSSSPIISGITFLSTRLILTTRTSRSTATTTIDNTPTIITVTVTEPHTFTEIITTSSLSTLISGPITMTHLITRTLLHTLTLTPNAATITVPASRTTTTTYVSYVFYNPSSRTSSFSCHSQPTTYPLGTPAVTVLHVSDIEPI